MGMEIDAFLFDFSQVSQGKHLKSAGIRQDRPIPVHKFMESSQLFHNFVSRTHMKMVGIGQFHLRADSLQIFCGNRPLDGRHSSHIHKNGGLNRAVDCAKFSSPGAVIFFQQCIMFAHVKIAFPSWSKLPVFLVYMEKFNIARGLNFFLLCRIM